MQRRRQRYTLFPYTTLFRFTITGALGRVRNQTAAPTSASSRTPGITSHTPCCSQKVGGISPCGGRKGGMSSGTSELVVAANNGWAASRQKPMGKTRRPKPEGRKKAEAQNPNKDAAGSLRPVAVAAADSHAPQPPWPPAFCLLPSAFCLPPFILSSSRDG